MSHSSEFSGTVLEARLSLHVVGAVVLKRGSGESVQAGAAVRLEITTFLTLFSAETISCCLISF